MNTPKDIFNRTYKILFNRFGIKAFSEGKDVGKVIQEKIDFLEEKKFFIGYDSENDIIEVPIEEIVAKIMSLRKRRIDFYKAILEEYQRNKKKYDDQLDSVDFSIY